MIKYLKIVLLVALAVCMLPIPAGTPLYVSVLAAVAVVVSLFIAPPKHKHPWGLHRNGSVNITLANGQLGATLQTNDGVVGLVMTGVSEVDGYTLATPILVTSLEDVATAGISEDNNPFAMRQLTEFFVKAGRGTQLYVMLVSTTVTVDLMADVTQAGGAKKLLDFADGKIKVLGLLSDDVAIEEDSLLTPTITNGLNELVYTAATNMVAMANTYFLAHKPFRAVIGATSFSGTASALTTINSGTTNNRTALLLADTESGAAACVGLLLGDLSQLPVQRKISRVANGAIGNEAAYLGTSTVEAAGGAASVIEGKGFITWKKYANTSGYFFSGDPMATATTDDYAMLARGRVIDKAHVLAYTTFVQVVDDEVPVNTDGTLDAGFCKWLSQQIVNQINNTMTANKEISSVTCFIDPAQNILSTNLLNVVLSIVPVGYATVINVNLGFSNPANA